MSTAHRDWFEFLSGERTGELLLPLLSGSMADALLPGDILTVRPMEGRKTHIGDIVVFREEGKLVAHRLIFAFRFLSFSLLVEKGDANPKASLLRQKLIVGRVFSARRGEKTVLSMSPEARGEGRRLSSRFLARYLLNELLKNFLKRMLGRDA